MKPEELEIALESGMPAAFHESIIEKKEPTTPSHYNDWIVSLRREILPRVVWSKLRSIIQKAGGQIEELINGTEGEPPRLEILAIVSTTGSSCRLSIRSVLEGKQPASMTFAIIRDPSFTTEGTPEVIPMQRLG